MIKDRWNRVGLFLVTSVLGILLSACGGEFSDDTVIRVGFGPSTYIDQFEEGVAPLLAKEGYQTEVRVLSQNAQINPALYEGSIDVAIHQSQAYMEEVNPHFDNIMVKLVDLASAPQSLRSTRHTSLAEVRDGMTVSIPNDPVNAERAARILEEIGWVTIAEDADIKQFSANDIHPGSVDLIFKQIESPQSLRTIDDVDFAIVNGNYVANAGLKMTDGLVVEKTPPEHVVIVVIRKDDLDKPWARALKAAYESDFYRDYIRSTPLYEGFIEPKIWQAGE